MAFITGAASGLGLALAGQYLAAGWQVAAIDCDGAALMRLKDRELAGALTLVCDVTSESALIGARDAVMATWGRIDLLVNNAGVALAGALEACSEADWQWVVEINLLGVVRGCRLFLPLLRAQRSGHIINIASVAALIHPPGMSAYCATKAAVLALSEVLEAELQGSGVGVSVVCPAFFRTGLANTSRTTTPALRRAIEQRVGQAHMDAATVATRIRAGVAAGRFMITTHPLETWLWRLKRVLPHPWYFGLMMWVLRRQFRGVT